MAKAIQTRPETFTFNFVTAAANSSGTIEVPPGVYYVQWYALCTNASGDSTILFERYGSSAQSGVVETAQGEVGAAASTVLTAYTIPASVNPAGFLTGQVNALGSVAPIGMAHGLKFTYVAGSATAADFTIVFTRVA